MSMHQIIYTSCMRGIEGVNDGQQIFSYDESFKESKTDDIKGLFTYQVPSLPAGTLMSEEIAKTMPSSYMYRLLKSGNVAVTLNTYLGRDYMGSAGRFGNHLSHSIVCDFADFNVYPCEMYASTALRTSMKFEEVNNPNPPAYLPVPELTKGYVVDTDSIIEFLGIEDNLEYYKKMVTALLRFSEEKRRILICDTEENIIKWIAALHYALPLDIAKTVNFTSYEYDPELSPAIICGVIPEGSRYSVSNYIASNRHYVFDFHSNQFNQVDYDDVFMDFLDTAFSFSYESLTEFHDFVISKTTYRGCSKEYYAAYYLYNLLFEGIAEIDEQEFKAIARFSFDYLTESVREELIDKLILESCNIRRLNDGYALFVLGFMLNLMNDLSDKQQRNIKQMIVDRLIVSISKNDISEDSFVPLYDNIDNMARSASLSIPAELMIEHNRDSILAVLEQNVETWKVLFVTRIICDYVKDMSLSADELSLNHDIGEIYFGIVKLMYSSGRQKGHEVVEHIIEGFKDSPIYYVNITLNLESFLNELYLTDSEIKHLWEYFYDTTLKMDSTDVDSVNIILLENEQYDKLYQLFDREIRKKDSLKDTREYFVNYWHKWFAKNLEYQRTFAPNALKTYESIYEQKIGDVSDKEFFKYTIEILRLAIRLQIKDDYVSVLCKTICKLIPLKSPDSNNLNIIYEIFKYQTEIMSCPVEGRLLLFWIALQLGEITNKRDIIFTAQRIKALEPKHKGAILSEMEDGKIKAYFEWAFDSVSNFSLQADDYMAIYDLFSFDRNTQKLFMEYWCKITYKKSKGNKDYTDFAEFLSFMFAIESFDDQEMVGRYLCKLSKQKLEDLDTDMRDFFKRNQKATHAWENVRRIASNTSPLLNNISGLFKRK